jgi:hypothetical protein
MILLYVDSVLESPPYICSCVFNLKRTAALLDCFFGIGFLSLFVLSGFLVWVVCSGIVFLRSTFRLLLICLLLMSLFWNWFLIYYYPLVKYIFKKMVWGRNWVAINYPEPWVVINKIDIFLKMWLFSTFWLLPRGGRA